MSANPYEAPQANAEPALRERKKSGHRDRIAHGEWFIECSECHAAFREESEGWRIAARTGRCMECRCFFDPSVEARVAEIAASPTTIRETRQVRIFRMVSGTLMVALGLGLGLAMALIKFFSLWLILAAGALLLFGARRIAFALLWTPVLEARNTLLRQTNVRLFAQRLP